ncbi:MAG: ubiquinol-cytochrome c reductase iron-sulfur subunit [Hyphomicrobiales bacterium]
MSETEPTDPERRKILVWLSRAFLALWVPTAGAVAASFMKAPSNEMRPGERLLSAGTLSSLAIGEARMVRHGELPVFVVRIGETQVVAVSAICTHLRCVLQWRRDSSTFRCPCHDGSFDKTGNVLSGPPKKPLPQYPTEIRGDEIVVHT